MLKEEIRAPSTFYLMNLKYFVNINQNKLGH